MKNQKETEFGISSQLPKDDFRGLLLNGSAQLQAQGRQNFKVSLCLIFLFLAMMVYSSINQKIVSHDPEMWSIYRRQTVVSDYVIGICLASLLAFLLIGGLSRLIKFPSFLMPSWVGRLALITGVLFAPAFFVELKIEASDKRSSSAIEPTQWFLVKNTSSCNRGRRSFSNCDNYHQNGAVFAKNGTHFRIVRYGNRTNYQCVLGQRYANSDGKMWLKIGQITSIEYETDFRGRITKNGWRELVKCTRRTVA